VLDAQLKADASITHVVLIHCETGAGVLNPLQAVADVCAARQGPDRRRHELSFAALPIDARKVRFDALVAASGKCLEGVPGMGFVFIRKAVLDGCAGHSQSLAMDLHDQYVYMEKTGQWRFTPPTHVVVALAEAMPSSSKKAASPRGWRATATTTARWWAAWRAGLQAVPRPGRAGAHHRHLPRAGATRATTSSASTTAAKARGFMLYPGKLTQVETFRVGCIGAIGPTRCEQAVHAVARHAARWDMGIVWRGLPAPEALHAHQGATTWPQPKSIPQLAAIRKSGRVTKVKVAVSDIDGILRGKYLHRDKFWARPSRTPRAASASATWCWAGT
jgi:2-aminoethylphosphonate-pyruvate transaminase